MIDRDPKHFPAILNYLRTGMYVFLYIILKGEEREEKRREGKRRKRRREGEREIS